MLESSLRNCYYGGNDLGAFCDGEKTVFKLWSPGAEVVFLNLYRNGNEGMEAFRREAMRPEENGVWSGLFPEDLNGVYYDYEIQRGEDLTRTADPYARACGANGARSMVLRPELTDPEGWEEDRAPEQGSEDVIYELNVREYSWDPAGGFPEEVRGTYRAFGVEDTTVNGDGIHPTGMRYLQKLGVTHIQLMPVYDFGSVDETGPKEQFNWGYDPVNYWIPEGFYSSDPYHGEVRVRECKEMVQNLHRNGFRVIMDVVYNHTYRKDSWLERTVPGYYYRTEEDGTWCNGSDCGNDVASERPMCGKYILDSVLYWAREYHMDGFRFDLMGLLDTDLMNRIQEALDREFGEGEKLIYGEPWSARASRMEPGSYPANKENIRRLNPRIGVFCDNTRDAVKGHVFERNQPGFVNGGEGLENDILRGVTAWCAPGSAALAQAPSQIITYVSAHDNLTLWDKLADTLHPEGGYHTESQEFRKAYRLAAAIYMTCQGHLFFLSGEEFGRTKEGLEDSYCSPISVNRLDWSRAWENEDLTAYYRGLIALRKRLPGLCDKSGRASDRLLWSETRPGVVCFRMDNRPAAPDMRFRDCDGWEELFVVYNRTENPVRVELPAGDWHWLVKGAYSHCWERKEPARGDSVTVDGVSAAVLGKTRKGKSMTDMKFIYGKNDFKTQERGEENCWLLTNGLGGFSSSTAVNSVTRNDHALLMASLKAPNVRWNLVHRLSERLTAEGMPGYWLSTQSLEGQEDEDGYRYLSEFSFEDYPEWRFHAGGVEVVRSVVMEPGANTVAVRYELDNQSGKDWKLEIIPRYQFVPKGQDLDPAQRFSVETGTESAVVSQHVRLYFESNAAESRIYPKGETCRYAYDVCDGRRENGRTIALHQFSALVPAGASRTVELVYSMKREVPGTEQSDARTAKGFPEQNVSSGRFDRIRDLLCRERRMLAETARFSDPTARMLAKSAGQFISSRESTGADTILAGFPFFEDWGRDTMIAMAGCCISVRRYETAKSILRTFAAYEKDGLMPNLFPEGGKEPMYNTVDAALLFINSVWLYVQKSGDQAFVGEMWPVMERIVEHYRKGTDFGIHMDADGLIMAGEGLDQVTWMDVRVGEILPTPRHGKPVEINAYWYNALRIMEQFSGSMSSADGQDYAALAEQVKKSFSEQFWLEEEGYLKDVVSGTKSDRQIRCNQIWAVSMPFTMLTREQEEKVVQTVWEKLYTPYGLRTLAPEDEEFHPYYGGEQLERDLAYHQGTVWVFPLGAYYLAYLKVHDNSKEAKETVRRRLEVMESALREGCVGQLPEIYDGENPTVSRGCFAQAWSVGEILRVYEALE